MKVNKLSIIIPVYNEEDTVQKLLSLVQKAPIGKIKKEIIVVNDGSSDKTGKILSRLKSRQITVINKGRNRGKGAAIRSALKKVTGDVVVIQDADLEYNPNEYQLLLEPIISGIADVVYGSRFVTTRARRVLFFWHSVGNRFLTLTSNALTNLNLTDMETCYKMFTKKIADSLKLEEDRFGFEPEFTAKIAKMNARVYEIGISYSGRNYQEGKKIDWRDGLWAFWCIIKYNVLE